MFIQGTKENENLPWIDEECQIVDEEILEVVANRDVNLFEDESDNSKSSMARQYRLALWTMYKRQSEVSHITELLKEFRFDADEIPFRTMIFGLIAPEKIVVDKCIPIYEELALMNENPFA